MSIDSTWLRCPNCSSDLSAVDERVFGCANGHRFDRSRHGFLTLLPPRAPRTLGDDRQMLSARARLLDGGAFAPIADAVVAAAGEVISTEPGAGAVRVADLGCGTGYYSARLAASFQRVDTLLADRSPDAVRMALRAISGATGVVLDIWSPLPLRDGSADVILDVFAPRNPTEFARILRADGRLIVVVPTVAHLHELRRRGMMLDIPAEKDAAVAEQLAVAGLVRTSSRRVEYVLEADAARRELLTGMGPSAHHATSLASSGGEVDARAVTVSVDVLSFGRRDL